MPVLNLQIHNHRARFVVKNCFLGLRKIGMFVTETLCPTQCLCCHDYGSLLCQKCQTHILFRTDQSCPLCQKVITPNGSTCPSCIGFCSLDGIISAISFKDTVVSKMIHTFKYGFVDDIAPILAQFLMQKITASTLTLPDILLPVPLHKRRLRWRGFNQAELLCKILADNLLPSSHLPYASDILMRIRNTTPQAKIPERKNRLDNMVNAFSINSKTPDAVKGKHIWIIDDISTTGATLIECAKVLKKSGAKEVWGVVVAS